MNPIATPDPLTLPYIANVEPARELDALSAVALTGTERHGPLEVATFIAAFGTITGTIVLQRFEGTTGLGAVSFGGPHRVDLAFGMATTMGLLPVELLHGIVVHATRPRLRLQALQVLGLLGGGWITPESAGAAAAAMIAASRDPDATVRSYAPVAAAAMQLGACTRALHDMRSRETDPAIIRLIDELLPQCAADGGDDLPEPQEPAGLRVSFLPLSPALEDALAGLPPELPRTAVHHAESWSVAAVRDAPPGDATARVMLHDAHLVGGIAVDGPTFVRLAHRLAGPFRMVPHDLALLAASQARDDWKTRARVALDWAQHATSSRPAWQRADELALTLSDRS